MITKRSNHIPTLTRMHTTKSTGRLRRTRERPQELGHDHVAGEHGPVGPGVVPEGPVGEDVHLVRVPAVPGGEELEAVGVAHHPRGDEDDLGHVVEVPQGDDLLQAEGPAADHHQGHDHGEAGEDRPRHEVGREHRGVPARHLRDREVHRHDRVDGEHERGREPGQDQVRDLVVPPVPLRAAPAEGEGAVDPLPDLRLRAVALGGEIGDEPHVPEEKRHRPVDAHREHVPQEGAAEVGPGAHLVGERGHPVGDPHPPDVDARVGEGAEHGEEGHRLRRPVDRGAPPLAEEEEDGGDEGPGVADPHPEHEVRDVPRPADGDVEAPDPDPLPEEPGHADGETGEREERHAEDRPPAEGRRSLDDARHDLGDRVEVVPAEDQRGAARYGIVGFALGLHHVQSSRLPGSAGRS